MPSQSPCVIITPGHGLQYHQGHKHLYTNKQRACMSFVDFVCFSLDQNERTLCRCTSRHNDRCSIPLWSHFATSPSKAIASDSSDSSHCHPPYSMDSAAPRDPTAPAHLATRGLSHLKVKATHYCTTSLSRFQMVSLRLAVPCR